MQVDAIKPGQTVVVIDDLIATGTVRPYPRATLLNPVFRRIGESRRRAHRKIRWQNPGIPLPHRAFVPQRRRAFRRARVFYD
jgi:hypothetical protein